MQELINRVASAAGIDHAKASQALSIVFSFLQEEGNRDKVNLLAAKLGVENLLGAGGTAPVGGGLMGSIGGMFGGGGGLMAVAGKLQGLGIGMGEITAMTKALAAFARERGAGDLLDDVARDVPGLSQFL